MLHLLYAFYVSPVLCFFWMESLGLLPKKENAAIEAVVYQLSVSIKQKFKQHSVLTIKQQIDIFFI